MSRSLTSEIDESPADPRIAAFFDLDRTLISDFSAFDFFRHGVRTGFISPGHLVDTLITAGRFQLGQTGFSGFVAGTTEMLEGRSEEEFTEMGKTIFAERTAAQIFPESRKVVAAHQKRGHTVAVVSASTVYQIEPVARDLGIDHILCTRLEVKKGKFTSEILRPACYGDGKAWHAKHFATDHGIDLSKSYFYTDSDEDLPLLDIVGNPRPTNPNRNLSAIAAARGWPARNFSSRGLPSATEVLRTSLALGSIIPSFALSLPAAALDGSWQRVLNLAMSTWGELGTALAGIDIHVSGEEHLWSHRPAVFIFNHQSALDTLILCKLLRRDMVGIAKKEIKDNPIIGPLFNMAGTIFLDRFDRNKAIAALRPAVEALRQGLSIAIAPEGTRSVTPKLGHFKKGAFHIAMQAKVPIVPIVLRNTLDALPKNALVVRPTALEAVVLPPIETHRWQAKNLDSQIRKIEKMYIDTLGQQPA